MENRYPTLLRKIEVIKEMLDELDLTIYERELYTQRLKEYEHKLAALDNAWFYNEI